MEQLLDFLNQPIITFRTFTISSERLLLAALVILIGIVGFQLIKKLIRGASKKHFFTKKKSISTIRFTRLLFILTTVIFFLKAMGFDTAKVIAYPLIRTEGVNFSLYHFLILYVIIFGTRLLIYILEFLLNERFDKQNVESGKGQSIFQIVKYFVWVIAIALFLEALGFSVTFLIASMSALLVGLGLGIQHFFNDIVSGIIILFDRSVKVGDIVEIQGEMIGKVDEISLRTSKMISRDDVVVIIPNSMFTSDRVINWSHNSFKTRFSVGVGVAYGSDVQKVKGLLIEAAMEHPKIDSKPEPMVLFNNFGDSSLDFVLQFYTDESFRVERIKSDLRFVINQKFIDHNVTIPFPQRDVHFYPKHE